MTIAYDDHPDPQPEDLHEWTARGFTVSEARRWIDNGFLMSSAGRWRDSGVYTPGDAFAWRTAGLTPYTVQPLLRAGMTPRDAVQWHELGYTHAGTSPENAHVPEAGGGPCSVVARRIPVS
jgi:hypothetical protein